MPDIKEKLVELMELNIDYGLADILAGHLIANGVTIPEWVDVADRLPDDPEELMLCVGPRGGVFIGHQFYRPPSDEVAICHVPNARQNRLAKYWMPLPNLPEGLKKK